MDICIFFFNNYNIYFSCFGEWCNSVLMWSSRNVLYTTKLIMIFHLYEQPPCTFPGEVRGWIALIQQQKFLVSSLSETLNTYFLISHWSILLSVSIANKLFEMKWSNLSKHVYWSRIFQNCETFYHKPDKHTNILHSTVIQLCDTQLTQANKCLDISSDSKGCPLKRAKFKARCSMFTFTQISSEVLVFQLYYCAQKKSELSACACSSTC